MTLAHNRLQRRNVGANGHWYLLDGQYAPGVTTVLGTGLGLKFDIPSGWASRICADWVIGHRPLLADPTWTDTDLHSMIRSAPRNLTYDAQVRGTTVHQYGEHLHNYGEVELADEHAHLAPYVEQYAGFLDRWEIDPIASETPLALTDMRVAGTADLIARSTKAVELINQWRTQDGLEPLPDDAPGVLDIKTGGAIRDKDKLQIVAYGDADLCHIDGVEQPKPVTYWHALIHVQADYADLHLIRPSYEDRLRSLFATAVQQWHALDEKRGWISHATDNVDRPLLAIDNAA